MLNREDFLRPGRVTGNGSCTRMAFSAFCASGVNPRGLDCLASGNNRNVKVTRPQIDEEIVLTLTFPSGMRFSQWSHLIYGRGEKMCGGER